MFMEERLEETLRILKRDGKVFVKDLSERFDVTEGMIRKDLQKLEQEGKLKRTYGGAILERQTVHDDSIMPRLMKNLSEKDKIAKLALNEIKDGDVIFLDASTTNYSIASMLLGTNKKVTVVTNMNRISILFDAHPSIDVICIGGRYNKNLGGTTGVKAVEDVKTYRFHKSFIGVGGINLKDDFISNFNLEEAGMKNAIIKSSIKTYLVAENEKFYTDGVCSFAKCDDIDFIISDNQPNEEILELLNEKNISIIY
ncbi:DeoR/GlpR family DNA-binding transcription regulator [Clostridium sp. B9]|uniref:DeoR/GlpR family DNA-binding transcription regulator n=1 Tax=Clostridium sp. B9 TaxID=3423224 RepID=UPI003D2F2D73